MTDGEIKDALEIAKQIQRSILVARIDILQSDIETLKERLAKLQLELEKMGPVK